MATQPDKLVVSGQFVVFTSYFSLLALLAAWNLTRPQYPTWKLLLLQALPLLLLLPGLMRKHYRTYIWLCFILLFYFIKGVEGVLISTAGASDYLFLCLVIILFISSMLCSRWIQQSETVKIKQASS